MWQNRGLRSVPFKMKADAITPLFRKVETTDYALSSLSKVPV